MKDGRSCSGVKNKRVRSRSKAASMSKSPIMQPIEDYDIQFDELIGQGAFGEVFIAKNVKDKSEIVVKRTKITKKNDGFLNNEAQTLRNIGDHANIVTLKFTRVHNIDKFAFLGFEKLEPISFTHISAQKAFRQITEALSFIRKSGYAHRDVKPENIMMINDGTEYRAKLIDFGISGKVISYTGKPLMNDKGRMGTPNFMSRRVCQGYSPVANDDAESLIYSIWAISHGKLPWEAASETECGKIIEDTDIRPLQQLDPTDVYSQKSINALNELGIHNLDLTKKMIQILLDDEKSKKKEKIWLEVNYELLVEVKGIFLAQLVAEESFLVEDMNLDCSLICDEDIDDIIDDDASGESKNAGKVNAKKRSSPKEGDNAKKRSSPKEGDMVNITDGKYKDKTAIIKKVTDKTCRVEITDGDRTFVTGNIKLDRVVLTDE